MSTDNSSPVESGDGSVRGGGVVPVPSARSLRIPDNYYERKRSELLAGQCRLYRERIDELEATVERLERDLDARESELEAVITRSEQILQNSHAEGSVSSLDARGEPKDANDDAKRPAGGSSARERGAFSYVRRSVGRWWWPGNA